MEKHNQEKIPELSCYKKMMEEKAKKKPYEDSIRGCMVGGGVGDALGYPVEFMTEKEIQLAFGPSGITSYHCSEKDDVAVVSDDTQMTMFTATGIVYGYTRNRMQKTKENISGYVYEHYRDWLHTQSQREKGAKLSWLRDIPELYVRRAPGTTCLNALIKGEADSYSKGCGGIMRVAPAALYLDRQNSSITLEELMKLDRDGAAVAAITHGHPLGYIPAAALVHIINRIVYGQCTMGDSLWDIVAECRVAMEQIYQGEACLHEFLKKLDMAVELSGNSCSDLENIRNLGEGWVAEEAFAIALYCSLRYQDDFSGAVIAAVNHGGDSDSTGAITGNIVGAIVGYGRIDDKWKRQLEFHHLLVALADDICYGSYMSADGSCMDCDWKEKYVNCRMPKGTQ